MPKNKTSRATGSPSTQIEKAERYTEAHIDLVVGLVARGKTINSIAKRLANGDKKAYQRWYWWLVGLTQDQRFEDAIMALSRGHALIAMPQAVQSASRLARRRMDAVKWLGEASGFHNPRVDHNIQGDIKVTIDMPRPVRDQPEGEPVVDADVVEE